MCYIGSIGEIVTFLNERIEIEPMEAVPESTK